MNAIEADGLIGAEITTGHIREVVLFSEGGSISWNGIRSDAPMISVIYEDGEVKKMYRSAGSFLTIEEVSVK